MYRTLLSILFCLTPPLYPAVVASWSAGSCVVGQNITVAPDAGPLQLNATPRPGQQNAPSCAQSGATRVIQFGGTPQGMLVSYNPALVNSESMTLRAKFRVTALIPPGSNSFRLFELRDSDLTAVYELFLENEANGRMRPTFTVGRVGGRARVSPAASWSEISVTEDAFVDLNTDYDLVASYNFPRAATAGTLRLFLNGKLIALSQATVRPAAVIAAPTPARTPALYLGSMLGGSQGFIGTVSEFQIRDDAVNGTGPTVSSVVNGATFASNIVSGSFATITGDNLSLETKDWSGSIVGNGPFPLTLGGVQVRINGRRAAISYVSPKQVNFIAPNDDAVGVVQAEITNLYGNVTAVAMLQRTSPGFFKANDRYPAAVFLDGVFLAPEKSYGDAVASRPAKGGDTVLFFLTGLGPTEQLVPAERVFTGVTSTIEKPKLYVCGMQADVQFSGIAGYVGLYQVNAVIPSGLPEGECEVQLQIGGLTTPGRSVIAIKP